MSEIEIDWELLHRYLADECTPDERARFDAWRNASPEHAALVTSLFEATAEPPTLPLFTGRDYGEIWARLEQTIASARPEVLPRPAPRLAPRLVLPAPSRSVGRIAAAVAWIAAAAVVLVLGAAAAGGVLWRTGEAATVATTAERVLRTPRGQRATFQLPDGTRVILGPASTLRYAADYGRRVRDVRLDGEAYFAVTHDARRPFTVSTGDLLAQDLGTEFTVRKYPEDRHARVVVREGEVGVRAAAADDATVRVLTAGQLGRLTSRGEAVVETVDLTPYFAWTEGQLIFESTPLREALPQLGRWFDRDFRLADSALGDIPITTTLEQQPTADVLVGIANALGLAYVRDGSAVVFHSRALP